VRSLPACAKGLLLALAAQACDPAGSTPAADAGADAASWLPAGYPKGFGEARACRASSEHFPRIRILVPAALASIYEGGPYPFPAGALVVKEEFEDSACRALTGYTLMRKEAPGFDPAGGDWAYQRLDERRRVTADGRERTRACAACHARCRARDHVCGEP
jgi:hypothetical protein